MKKSLLVVLFLFSLSVKAEVFGTASTLSPNTVMVGAEIEALLDPNDFMTNFHLGYGILDDLDMDLRIGTGTVPFYFGGDIEYQLLKHEWLDISISAGPHYQEEMFLDITPIISHRFKKFSISTGLDLNWKLSGGSLFCANWFMGTAIPALNGLDLIFEFGINIKDAPHWISGGVALFF